MVMVVVGKVLVPGPWKMSLADTQSAPRPICPRGGATRAPLSRSTPWLQLLLIREVIGKRASSRKARRAGDHLSRVRSISSSWQDILMVSMRQRSALVVCGLQ